MYFTLERMCLYAFHRLTTCACRKSSTRRSLKSTDCGRPRGRAGRRAWSEVRRYYKKHGCFKGGINIRGAEGNWLAKPVMSQVCLAGVLLIPSPLVEVANDFTQKLPSADISSYMRLCMCGLWIVVDSEEAQPNDCTSRHLSMFISVS